jgi:peptidoglycan/LPS O-acetylase OafA/YrhL
MLLGVIYWRDLPGLIEWGTPASIVFMGIFVYCLSLDAARIVKVVVNYLGRISYCVYLAQFTTIPILRHVGVDWSTEINWLILVCSTLLLAVFSYHFIEVLAYEKTRMAVLSLSRSISVVFGWKSS